MELREEVAFIMKIKRKLGLLYWKIIGWGKTALYKTKRILKSVWVWLLGALNRSDVSDAVCAKEIVVCAHPDDETIFFSSILKSKKPFVVCASNRGHKVRKEEFEKALAFWGVEGIMLNFPDVPGLTFVWRWRMAAKLKKIRNKLPSVTTVYTHSASGESGHPHHYAVSNGVEKAFEGCRIITTAVAVPEKGDGRLAALAVEEKYSAIKTCYPSQINMLEKWCPWWESYLSTEYFEE